MIAHHADKRDVFMIIAFVMKSSSKVTIKSFQSVVRTSLDNDTDCVTKM